MTQLFGVILAGGKSLRMGEDKANLQIDGVTLLERMTNILMSSKVSEVLINRNTVGALDSLDDECKFDKVEQIQDIIANKGPLSGIHSALVNYPNANLLVVPVDMPFISTSSLNELIAHATTKRVNCRFSFSGKNANGSKNKTSTLPLFIHNNSEVRKLLEHTLLHTNTLSVYHFCSLFPLLEVPLDNENELTNLNYPEQLNQLTNE